MNLYHSLCESIDVDPVDSITDMVDFSNVTRLADAHMADRLANALSVFVDLVIEQEKPVLNKVDRWFIDTLIAQLDKLLSAQLDAILHHKDFKQLEAAWLSLYHLLDKVDAKANSFVYLLNIDKETLKEDFDDALDITQSGLYKQVYDQAYDMPGGKPISTMISGFSFSHALTDVQLLTDISKVSASAHCPYIANIDPIFFGKKSIEEINNINNLSEYIERPEYIHWNRFREMDQSRYIGLTLPKFLLRLPYGSQNPVRGFLYEENVSGIDHYKYTWGAASYAFGGNLAIAFKKHGWTVNIRGPESGGKVDDLNLHQYDVGRGIEYKIPTEVLISESKELELSHVGLIPLSYYKDSKHACFFSANSVSKPILYDDKAATANSRVNSRLPYVFLASRLGHYLKVIQRENIGGTKDRGVLEQELNRWLGGLITKMANPSADLVASRPLKEGKVLVSEIDENPGFFKVSLHIIPHFQVEGIDVKLSLVSQIPVQ